MSSNRDSRSTDDGAIGVGPRLLMGEHVYLRRMERTDLPHIYRWLSDAELCGLIGHSGVSSVDEVEAWFERVSTDPTRRWYAVVTSDGDRVIGEAGLLRLNDGWRTTDMSIIIGERDDWRRGFGTEVGRILLDFAFNYCGVHRVAIGVVGFHEPALRFWEKLGFSREGVQRDGYLHGGEFHDFVMMSILEGEWREQQARR